MDKTYSVRFFTDGGTPEEHIVNGFESNKFIPIPSVGDVVFLEDDWKNYIVKKVNYCYPCSDDEEYAYDICVFVEAEN